MTQLTDPAAMREVYREDTGQFGAQPHRESGVVDLWDPADGSYAFPPIPKTADDVIRFWTLVDIPDDALETMVRCSQEATDAAVERERDAVLNSDPGLRARIEHGAGTRSDEARWEQLVQDAETAVRENAPLPITRAYAKTVVRIASMAHWAEFLQDPTERDTVLSKSILVPGNTLTTPARFWEAYGFDAFYEKATERPTSAESAATLRDMADSLRVLEVNSNVDSDLRFQHAEDHMARRKGR